MPDLNNCNDYFEFSRGRFIYDEAQEMSQRRVCFDMNELVRLAAEAVSATSHTSIVKYPEGQYNKAFLITLDNGAEVVVKVPNPNAGRPHFTTSSEVATMEFMRERLGMPVPKVYSWCSHGADTQVGAEFIIMEKLPGTPLGELWPSIGIRDRLKIVQTILTYQKSWMSVAFSQFGSLYFAQDIENRFSGQPLYEDQNGNPIMDQRFAVGPSNARETIGDGRASIDFDRGPWQSVSEYLEAIGRREEACIRNIATLPKSPVTLCGPGTYQPTREKKLHAIKCYLGMMKYLLPTQENLSMSHIWHSDLHIENILADPDCPTKVTGIIDWQSTELAPLFFQARPLPFLKYDGPLIRGLGRPTLPDDYNTLEPAEQKQAYALYLERSLYAAYKLLVSKKFPTLYPVVEYQETLSFDMLLLARNLLIDGEPTYLAQTLEMEGIWNDLPGVRAQGNPLYPFKFSESERIQIETDVEGALRGMQAMRELQSRVGDLFPEQGVVSHERYQEAIDALGKAKREVIDQYASTQIKKDLWNDMWPFNV